MEEISGAPSKYLGKVRAGLWHWGETSMTLVSPDTSDNFLAKDPGFTPGLQGSRHPSVLPPRPTQH